jgi:single-strand DNA-binding protein
MAEGLNRVMLLGNLGADPELRMTNGGQAVLKLRLATSETYLDRNKVRQERTEWHSVVVWGKRAEALAKFLTKGSRIFVEGGLRTSSYDDKEGNKRYKTEVVANNIILSGSGGGGGARGGGGGGGGGARSSEGPGPGDDAPAAGGGGGGYSDTDYGGGGDDEIPF